MYTNNQILKTRWLDIKNEIRRFWPNLTETDLDETKSDIRAIEDLIQIKNGWDLSQNVRDILSTIFFRYDTKTSVERADYEGMDQPQHRSYPSY